MIDEDLIIPVKAYVRLDAITVNGGAILKDELMGLSNILVKLPWWYDLVNLAEMVSAARDKTEQGYYVYNITWLLPEEQKLLFMIKYREKMPFIATVGESI